MIEKNQLDEIRNLYWAIEQGVKWGRIPLAEAVELFLGLRERYPGLPLVIDGDAEPSVCPDWVKAGWRPVEHRKSGLIIWDPAKVRLVPCDQPLLTAATRHKWIRSLSSFNANVLDALILPENEYRIPVEWKGLIIYFGDTVFDSPTDRLHGGPFVRCLIHCPVWTDGCHSLSDSLSDRCRLIVPA